MNKSFFLPAALAIQLVAVPVAVPAAQAGPQAPAAGDSARAAQPVLFGVHDLRFMALSLAATALATRADRWVSEKGPESDSRFARDLATAGEHFGNPLYAGSALAVVWAAGRISGRPGLSSAALRITGGAATAAAVSGGLKFAVGRARPSQTPGDIDEVHPFSGDTSFPSGHTALAFALAAGIDHETRARWVPCVAYPVAGLVGWSRVRDNRHWLSDVVAGALVGCWSARKFEEFTDPRGPRQIAVSFAPAAGVRGIRITADTRF